MSNNIEHKAFWDAQYELVIIETDQVQYRYGKQITANDHEKRLRDEVDKQIGINNNHRPFIDWSYSGPSMTLSRFTNKPSMYLDYSWMHFDHKPAIKRTEIRWENYLAPKTFVDWIKHLSLMKSIIDNLNNLQIKSNYRGILYNK